MPSWFGIVVGISALVTAMGVLWVQLLRPAMHTAAAVENAIPVLRRLVAVFSGDPDVFTVLDTIAAQFRTNSGSSLRDVVNRLESAATDTRAALDVARQLAQRDHDELHRLALDLHRVTNRLDQMAGARPSEPR